MSLPFISVDLYPELMACTRRHLCAQQCQPSGALRCVHDYRTNGFMFWMPLSSSNRLSRSQCGPSLEIGGLKGVLGCVPYYSGSQRTYVETNKNVSQLKECVLMHLTFQGLYGCTHEFSSFTYVCTLHEQLLLHFRCVLSLCVGKYSTGDVM